MNFSRQVEEDKFEIQIAPLIDVVFLLLIYFMVTTTLIKKEADIGFVLPANIAVEEMQDIPVEALIEINSEGIVEIEGMRFAGDDEALDDLILQLRGLKEIAVTQRAPFYVNLIPHKRALHSRIIDVMDACSAAGVDSLTFGKSQE
jgi:biopolymer transport protein ExbD